MNPVVTDTECYRNYWLAAFKEIDSGRVLAFERTDDSDFDSGHLERVLNRYLTIGFNSRPYDLPMIYLALKGLSCAELKQASDRIIVGNMKPWDVERHYGIRIPKLDHIDLIEVAPGQASLKIYGGRLHAPRMQDLPIDPDADLTPADKVEIKTYCINDLDTTALLFTNLREKVELRSTMGQEYGQELRSKSDAQVAEAVIKSQIQAIQGSAPSRPSIAPGTSYKYRVPDYIRYQTPQLVEMLDAVRASDFTVSSTGNIEMPPALEKAEIRIGSGVYRMGIGGLHSSEQTTAHFSDDETLLIDRDVASYYPAIILTQRLAPRHIGDDFLSVYDRLVKRRLAAKRDGDKATAESLKITINGSFGKLGSKWSALYSPDLMIQVTITGQLALLRLIESAELAGIPVVSANTDGVVFKCPKSRYDDLLAIVREWEGDTGFETEETRYRALYSRDVNNYFAVKENAEVKAKGAYAEPGLQKNPTNQICVEAVTKLLTERTPICETIERCDDIRQFVTVRTVQGGAIHGDRYLGKAIRWYYGKGATAAIHYKKVNKAGNHNKVPRSDGAVPLMDLPADFPADVDHRWYIKEAALILRDIGYRGNTGDPIMDLLG